MPSSQTRKIKCNQQQKKSYLRHPMCRKKTTTDVISSFPIPIRSPRESFSPSTLITTALRIELESFNSSVASSSTSDGTSHGCCCCCCDKDNENDVDVDDDDDVEGVVIENAPANVEQQILDNTSNKMVLFLLLLPPIAVIISL